MSDADLEEVSYAKLRVFNFDVEDHTRSEKGALPSSKNRKHLRPPAARRLRMIVSNRKLKLANRFSHRYLSLKPPIGSVGYAW